jgi:hypothetical protein
MARIAYFVHGRGKGHAVRTRAVVERLRGDDLVRLYCAGRAYDVLRDHPGAEEVLTVAPGPGMLRAFGLRFRADRQRLRRFRPCLVVSDGDGPSVNAAWSLGFPVLAIGHGLVFRHTRLGPVLSPLQRFREVLNAATSSWPAAHRIAVHFAPVEAATRGTTVVRPDLFSPVALDRQRGDFLLAYFRDDNGLEPLERLAARGHRVVLFGRPSRAPRGVEVQEPSVEQFREALSQCGGVVGSAGNHLPAECAMLGLPMLALHRDDDSEHAMNARLIEAAGIGVGASLGGFDAGTIARFERELGRDRTELAHRTRAMPAASQVIPNLVDDLCRPARPNVPLRMPLPEPGR